MRKERGEEGERRKQRVVRKREVSMVEEREKNGKEVFACARNFLSLERNRDVNGSLAQGPCSQ